MLHDFQALDCRVLLASSLNAGVLTVTGDAGANSIQVEKYELTTPEILVRIDGVELTLVDTAGLREGQNTPLEVMDARQALTKASANYYQSLFSHAMARVSLQKAMGLMSEGALPDGPVLK